MRILFLEQLFPEPLDSGSKIKSYSTLKALASKHEIAMVSYCRSEDDVRCSRELLGLCVSIKTVPLVRSKMADVWDATKSLLCRRSFIVSRDFRRQMLTVFTESVRDFHPGVVHVDHLQMARFVDFDAGYATVLDQHNVEHVIVRRIAKTSDNPAARLYASLEWPRLRDYEMSVCRQADMILTVSEEDKAELCRLDPSLSNVHSLPIGIDVERYSEVTPAYGSHNVLFTGTMYWPPNVDCVHYFHREILPLVRKRVPDCTFTVAGQRPVWSVRALSAQPGITVTGYIEDDRDVATNGGVFVVPLRSGSGVRVKILTAMAMGLPIVSTSVGAEGIDAVSGEHLLIADSPPDFADAVVKLLTNCELAQRLGRSARALAREKYSWQKAGARVLDLYDQFVVSKARSRPIETEHG